MHIYFFFPDFKIKFRLGKVTQIYTNEAETRELPRAKVWAVEWDPVTKATTKMIELCLNSIISLQEMQRNLELGKHSVIELHQAMTSFLNKHKQKKKIQIRVYL